jgi:hypothetical protein
MYFRIEGSISRETAAKIENEPGAHHVQSGTLDEDVGFDIRVTWRWCIYMTLVFFKVKLSPKACSGQWMLSRKDSLLLAYRLHSEQQNHQHRAAPERGSGKSLT